jgi:hypothetical protein
MPAVRCHAVSMIYFRREFRVRQWSIFSTGLSGGLSMYDAIIVGARCAGSPLAMVLARKGYRVLLTYKSFFQGDTISTHHIHQPGVIPSPLRESRTALSRRNCWPKRLTPPSPDANLWKRLWPSTSEDVMRMRFRCTSLRASWGRSNLPRPRCFNSSQLCARIRRRLIVS